MRITIDAENITDAGFDRHLFRQLMKGEHGMDTSRTLTAENLVGGIIGKEGILYLGSMRIRIDGKEQRIIVNDGTTDRVLIGKF